MADIEAFVESLSAPDGFFTLIFDFMEVAEEEVERGGPDAWHAFSWMAPPLFMLDVHIKRELWRSSCRELVERYLAHRTEPFTRLRQAMAPATDAELLRLLSQVTLAVPLSHDYSVAYQLVFRSVLPDCHVVSDGTFAASEHAGEYHHQLVQRLKRSLTQSVRRDIRKEDLKDARPRPKRRQEALPLG